MLQMKYVCFLPFSQVVFEVSQKHILARVSDLET